MRVVLKFRNKFVPMFKRVEVLIEGEPEIVASIMSLVREKMESFEGWEEV